MSEQRQDALRSDETPHIAGCSLPGDHEGCCPADHVLGDDCPCNDDTLDKDAASRELRPCAECGHPHVPWLAGPGVCPNIGCDCKVWVEPTERQDAQIRHGEPWESEGSFVIERYVYIGPRGGEGVQWIVWRVKKGELVVLRSCDTLSEALEVAGALS